MVEWLSLRRLCSEKTVCATEDEVRRSNRGTKLKNGGIRHPPNFFFFFFLKKKKNKRFEKWPAPAESRTTAEKLSPSFLEGFRICFKV